MGNDRIRGTTGLKIGLDMLKLDRVPGTDFGVGTDVHVGMDVSFNPYDQVNRYLLLKTFEFTLGRGRC